MCFVILTIDVFPLFSNSINILLYFYKILSSILYHCDLRKHMVHSIWVIPLYAAKNPASVGIQFFNL